MKELTLHIGLPKTGTSTLQHYFTDNFDQLKQQGIYYPQTGRPYVAHHGIAQACKRLLPVGSDLSKLRREFDAEVASSDQVLLSSEAFQDFTAYLGVVYFFGLPREKPPYIQALAPIWVRRHRIRTFCYLREFLEFAGSNYAQRIQNTNMFMNFDEFCCYQFRRPLLFLTGFWTWFSDEIQFAPFERAKLYNKSIVDDFFWRIGADMPSPALNRDANPSIAGNLLAFKLFLNAHSLHSKALYGVCSELAREDPAFRGRFRITDSAAKDLRQRFQQYNKKVEDLVGKLSYKSFHNEKPILNPDTWSADVERFLSHPGLAHLKDHPAMLRASTDATISELRKKISQ